MKQVSSYLFLILLAVLFAIFLLYPLVRRGMEISPDSVSYLKTATNVAEGYGFSLGCPPLVHPNRHWPPGFSALIASFLVLGVDWLTACKTIAIVCYILLLVGTSFYVFRITGSMTAASLSEAAVGFHPTILRYNAAILSEALSWVFLVGISSVLTVAVLKPQKKWALLLGIILGLSILVRYAYMPFAVVSVVLFLLLTFHLPWRRRFGLATLISVPVIGLFGGWLVRNFLLFGKVAKARPPAGNLLFNIWDGMNSWAGTLFETHPSVIDALLWTILICIFVISLLSLLAVRDPLKSPGDLATVINFVLAIGYTVGLIVLKTYSTELALNDRKFTQIVILFVLMLAAAVASRRKKVFSPVSFSLIAIFCLWSVYFGVSEFPYLKGRWLGFYELQYSPAVEYAISFDYKPHRIVTNVPEAFWLRERICTRSFRARRQMKASYFEDNGARLLVWFKRTGKRPLLEPQDVEWDIPVRQRDFKDAYVYQLRLGGKRLRGEPGPGQKRVRIEPSELYDSTSDSEESEEE